MSGSCGTSTNVPQWLDRFALFGLMSGLAGRVHQPSQPSIFFRSGTPPAWTTWPSMTTPGVLMTP